MTVESGHVGLVLRFGAIERAAPSGLGLHLPWPIESHEVLDVTEVRRVETGSRRLLTGDTNLVDLDLVVQYTVRDPVQFVTGLDAPQEVVASTARSVATEVVASMDVDTLLTTGRASLQLQVADEVQKRLDGLDSGVLITGVEVRELAPPPAVVDAFNDVSSARGDRATLALAAESYASTVLPEARGQAALRVEQARAFSSQRVSTARGDVARFEALVDQDGPALRGRLHAETAKAIDAEVMVVSPHTEVVLP
jgi:modulator of FtsH protease HflK